MMKSHLFTLLIDVIFPPSADELVLRNTTDDVFSAQYRYSQVGGIHSLLPYKEKSVQAAVHLAKFHAHARATRMLGMVLAHHLTAADQRYLILPIPLSKPRQRKRGYNQVENILASGLRHCPCHKLTKGILVRTRDTKAQTSLPREARLANVAGAFGIRDVQRAEKFVRDQHVLIVDDVTTTGSTLKAAQAALLPLSPASITLLALAH